MQKINFEIRNHPYQSKAIYDHMINHFLMDENKKCTSFLHQSFIYPFSQIEQWGFTQNSLFSREQNSLIIFTIQRKILNNQAVLDYMDIELEQMEHGKAINFSNMGQDKENKIKTLKSKKQYSELLEYANNLPPNKDKYLLKANTLMHLKKWKELIECCDKGLEEDDESEFFNMKGRAHGKLGNMQEKADNTRKAISLDPSVPAYYRNLGAALYKLKNYEQAIVNHKKAMQMEPNNSINYHNIGAALFRQEKYEEAKEYFQKSISKNQKEALSHSWLGDCHKKLNQHQQAIFSYDKAYKVSGNEVYKKQRDALQKVHGTKKGFFSKFFN